jgi:outer membrane protein assembly factor BamB
LSVLLSSPEVFHSILESPILGLDSDTVDSIIIILRSAFGGDPFTDPVRQNIITAILTADFNLGDIDRTGTAPYLAPPTVANGVVFAGSVSPNFFVLPEVEPQDDPYTFSLKIVLTGAAVFAAFDGQMDENMFAYDAQTGQILWSYPSFGLVAAGPAVVDGVLYWGSTVGTPSTLYAFQSLPHASGSSVAAPTEETLGAVPLAESLRTGKANHSRTLGSPGLRQGLLKKLFGK